MFCVLPNYFLNILVWLKDQVHLLESILGYSYYPNLSEAEEQNDYSSLILSNSIQ